MKKFKGLIVFFAVLFSFSALAFSSFAAGDSEEKPQYVTVTFSDKTKKNFKIADKLDYAFEEAFYFAEENANKNNKATIVVPKGNLSWFYTGNYITIDLSSGVTVKNFNLECVYSKTGGYDGLHDFGVTGGVFYLVDQNSCPSVRFAHCKNISFKNCTFLYGGSNHFIELAACKNFTFDGCTFKGTSDTVLKSGAEALQIDIHDQNFHFTNAGPYIGAANDTIIVKNCKFSKVSRGVGTRNMFAGYYQNNIKIYNNSFSDLSATAIVLSGCVNSVIKNNTIKNCGEGICYYAMSGDGNLKNVSVYDNKGKINKDCKTEISGNVINLKKTKVVTAANGIYICGNVVTTKKTKLFKAGDYYVGKITVKNNTISTPEYGIRLFDTKNSTVSANTIKATAKAQNAIYLGVNSDNNTITSNKISGKFDSGFVLKDSGKNVIKSNTVSAPNYYGINLQVGSKSNYVSKNTVKNCGAVGINIVSASCEVLSTNTVQNSGTHGICVMSKSTVTNANSNKVSGSKANGVYIDAGSRIQNFKDNSISSSSNNGVHCVGTLNNVSNNTFKSNKKLALVYANGASGSVFKNTYTSNKGGIAVVQVNGKNTKFSNLSAPSVSTKKSSSSVTLKWKAVTNANTYIIFKSDKKDGTYKQYTTTKKLSLNIKTSNKGYYKIKAVEKVGKVCIYSGYSNTVKI
ncbi:MAG: right-handed parallel beta-helix repeat-containing protein [Acutalibacteraceae bacterium]